MSNVDNSSTNIQKKELKKDNLIIEILSKQSQNGTTLGKAVDNGDCFFDSLAQAINRINSTDANSVKNLRCLYHDFYLENKQLVEKWNNSEYASIDRGIDDYYFVQYKCEEVDDIGDDSS